MPIQPTARPPAHPPASPSPITIRVGEGASVSGLLDEPARPQAWCVLAHGAGAGMQHAFMAALAAGLCARGIAVLRFQFPFMERGSRRPDPPRVAQAAVRASVDEARRRAAGLPLFAGGKSFGARMTTQAHAADPLPGVSGLVLVGYPLHPAGRPSVERADHLVMIRTPMLLLQGTRDTLADLALIRAVVSGHAGPIQLQVLDGADHSFHLPAGAGRSDGAVLEELTGKMVGWMRSCRP